jgi:hypothetical protein
MTLVYLVNKPQVLRKIARWLLLFLEYDFIIVYKSSKTHVVVDVLFRLLNTTKPTKVVEQTTDASLSFIEPKWLNDVKIFFTYMTNGRVFVDKTKTMVGHDS